MLNLTRLLCGVDQSADALRYGRGAEAPASASARKPVVVWNITRRCNLRCLHCYSNSEARSYPGELTWAQSRAVIEDLAEFGIPALLFSGGEPMIHPGFFDLAALARDSGLRLTLSTNGTLIDAESAERIRDIGFAYVGISLDGIGETHDYFRGRTGAFTKAVAAFRHCKEAGQKVGLRLTLSRHTVKDIEAILDFIEAEGIDRVCFYHLVYSGRGADLALLRPEETRHALDTIMDRVERWHRAGLTKEVLTVDQPADGPYLLDRLERRDSGRADAARELLEWNGGGNHGSGVGLANIDTQGDIHPDQFWQSLTLGNVKRERFSQVWTESADPVLRGLRSSPRPVGGRCAGCRHLAICGGGFRVRAWQRYGDPWAEDPACYLDETEIRPPEGSLSRSLT
ncbi:MAG: radical SAM protein [Verrucomicrobiales bacterium]